MRAYESSAVIKAAPAEIWAIMTDGAGYQRWDSGVVRVEGRIAPGEKIKVVSSANPGKAFPVTVSEFRPGERMVWSGGTPGIFRGVRTYTLTRQGDATRFTLREEYTGLLAPLIFKTIPNLQPSFDQYAAGLKARAEGTA